MSSKILEEKKILEKKKILVEGIILVLTCNKYKNNKRLRKLRLTNYNGWKVIYVVGNLLQKENYIYNSENNFLSIKVEDSYLHLYKKLIKSIEILYELYNIKEGILRCGDDLVFNEINLIKYLKKKDKPDYEGKMNHASIDLPKPYSRYLTNNIVDRSMIDYYNRHKEDALNPLHNVANINIPDYSIVPVVLNGFMAIGILYYISNNACKILCDNFKKANYNILYFDRYSLSYPYIIEDVATGYVLTMNDIKLVNNIDMWINCHENFDKNVIAYHTCLSGRDYKWSSELVDNYELMKIGAKLDDRQMVIRNKPGNLQPPKY